MRLINTNTGAAKPATGKLAGGLLASGPFSHTKHDPHNQQDLRKKAVFCIQMIAVCAATLAAIHVADKALGNIAHTIQQAEKEKER